MRGYTHVAFATCTIPVLPNTNPAVLFGLLTGALMPDVDVKGSPASRIIYVPVEHRGFFHSLLACALFTAGLYAVSKDFATGFAVGYLSHIFLDMLNPAGVMLFFPNRRKYRLLRIKVGSLKEYLLLFAFSIIGFFILISQIGKIAV